jgi:hypothetical protein
MSAGETTSREQLAADIAALHTFASEYQVYLGLKFRFVAGDRSSQALLEQSRTRIWQLLPTARRAMVWSGPRRCSGDCNNPGRPRLLDNSYKGTLANRKIRAPRPWARVCRASVEQGSQPAIRIWLDRVVRCG